MIKDNMICFGYGDVAVKTHIWWNEIKFQQFKPPQEIDTRVDADEVEWIGECIKLELNKEECVWWTQKLRKVLNRETNAFEFKGYVFDFSNYNEKSVAVVLKHIDRVHSYLVAIMAC